MTCVFDARSGVEAHMVLHLLQRCGIAARIEGELLAGGMGELPVFGLIRVVVEPGDKELALQAIRDWEAGKFSIGEIEKNEGTPDPLPPGWGPGLVR
jgi:Putative prokaryotic signal transducing protein